MWSWSSKSGKKIEWVFNNISATNLGSSHGLLLVKKKRALRTQVIYLQKIFKNLSDSPWWCCDLLKQLIYLLDPTLLRVIFFHLFIWSTQNRILRVAGHTILSYGGERKYAESKTMPWKENFREYAPQNINHWWSLDYDIFCFKNAFCFFPNF